MRATRLYENKKPVISMEFFPPRTEKTIQAFGTVIDQLAVHQPDYMSVTFGAGGSTRDGSYQTVKQILEEKNIPTVAYIAAFGLGPEDICKVLDSYKNLGVETIFVIRGDEPKEEGFTPHPDHFPNASGLLAFIKKNYDFTLGCAGYPEGHLEAQSPEKDLKFLKLKIDNGAEYIVSQYFYDNDFFFRYVEKCRKLGIHVPIVPGVMPVYTLGMTRSLSQVCGSSITDALNAKLQAVDPKDSEAVLNLGIDFAVDQCRGLLKAGVCGLHFYTMNRSKSTGEIISQLKKESLLPA
ncbi:MAG: 5,10-methylenetetrahydrofolate reductase [Desulfobacteraceae bacterium]|nr:5,10-methylenetetrahydrofolate reductase [Desulfobacteraceae bacterium]MBU4000824.1 methylenetetrahydrofolate reductase [Pseudomonadota bacterium]MBU4054717.1 methylenetetrahydrofolate reductase [Pseudomonadota bacterium]